MVKKKDIKKDDIKSMFDSLYEAQTYISNKGYNMRSFQSKEEFLDQLKKDIHETRAEKQALLDLRKNNERVFTGTNIPHVKHENISKRSKFVEICKNQVQDIDNDYLPRFVQIKMDKLFDDVKSDIMTSEDKADLVSIIQEKKMMSKLIQSEEEYVAHMRKIRSVIEHVNDNVDDIFNSIDWETYIVSHVDDIGLVYTVNGYTMDFTQYILSTYTEEPILERDIVDNQGRPLNCYIKAILSQIPRYLGIRRRNKLISMNKPDMTINDMREIAESVKISVKLFDCEADIWKMFDYCDNTKTDKGRRVYCIMHNKHIWNIIPQIRKALSNGLTTINVERGTPYLTPLDSKCTVYRVCDFRVVHDDLYNIIGLEVKNNESYVSYTDIEHDTICYTDINLEVILKFLIKRKVYPFIINQVNMILSLSFNVGQYNIRIRHDHKHALFDNPEIPLAYNLTLGSCAMYLFRRHIETSLLKISAPVINRVFKSMAKPLIYMKRGSVEGHVYLIDINKAYRSQCSNLGGFESQPSLRINPNYCYLTCPPGIYEKKNGEWITHEDIRRDKISSCNIRYYVQFDKTVDVLSTFTNVIDNIETDAFTKKHLFNILVGKLNPHHGQHTELTTFSDKVDLDRFLMKPNKRIISIAEIESSYLVEYTFDTDSSWMASTNVSYLSAQIIHRCKSYVRNTSEILKNNGCTIWGSMTDSILFSSPTEVDLSIINVGEGIGEWSVCYTGSKLDAYGVGQYDIWDDDTLVVRKMQGGGRDENSVSAKGFNRLVIEPITQTFTRIIGKAGVGKSHYILANYPRTKYLRTAYTGIAASSISSKTLSSIFRLGLDDLTVEESLARMTRNTKSYLLKIEGMVIDEYYTLPASIMHKVDEILRFIRQSCLPFGGLDMVFVGDDRQTSAVDKAFVDTKLFTNLVFIDKLLEEHPNMRLTKEYSAFCDKFRNPRIRMNTLIELLQDKRFSKVPVSGHGTRFVFHENIRVNECNARMMDEMEGDYIYEKFKKNCPIMITKNHRNLYNGTLGILKDVRGDSFVIDIDGVEMTVKEIEFKPAFAMTIHKAQCNTFSGVNIFMNVRKLKKDLRLIYTALSRVRDFCDCYVSLK